MREAAAGRRAGLLIPLFSCPSTASWGIGDIGDLAPLTAWLAAAGQRVLQLLPINEMAPGQQSPYSAISAMAIDPIYICVAVVPDFAGDRRRVVVARGSRAARRASRQSPAIDYAGVRRLKRTALAGRLRSVRRGGVAPRLRSRAALRGVPRRAGWWLDDYALFRALHDRRGRAAVDRVARAARSAASRRRSRTPAASSRREVLFHQYLQWLAHDSGSRPRAQRRTASRCSATCRSWWTATAPTSGRARTSSASTRPSARRPTRSARPARTGACRSIAGTSSPPTISGGCATARGAAPSSSTATASITSSASIARTAAARRRRAVLHAGRRTRPDRARRTRARSSASRGRDHRRRSRHRPRLRARVARAARRSGLSRVPVGARVAQRGAAVSRSVGYPAAVGRRSGTHDTEPLAAWWDERHRRGAAADCRAADHPAARGRRVGLPTRLTIRPCATCCSRRSSRPAPTRRCFRCRTCSAGAIASTSRRPSTTATGRSAAVARRSARRACPKRASAQARLRCAGRGDSTDA